MLKTLRHVFLFLVVLSLSTVLACSDSSPAGPGGKTASATVSVDVQAPSKASQKFIGTINDITSLTVDVLRGGTPLITGQPLTYSGGVWSGTLENLPIGPSLTFVGHAFNVSAVEIFTGTTVQAMTGTNDSVTILMAPVDDGVPAVFPRITRITVPAQIVTSSTVTIGILVEASSGETLTYAVTAAPGGGIFSSTSGTINISDPGTTATLVLSYSAPSTTGIYTHSIRVTNSQTNWVETDFSTMVVVETASASLNVQFSPVITAIGAKRSGSDVTFTAAVSDTGPLSALTYSWGFDAGLLTFASNTVNPATLQGYDETIEGNLTLTVTNGVGGATTVSYYVAPGLLPDNVTQYQLIFSEYVEGSSLNKALEIWNPSSEAVDLQACAIRTYSNGSPTAGSTITLSSILPSQQTFVLCHNSFADPPRSEVCDALSSSLSFNGDDAVELVCNNVTVDVFGTIGSTAWAGLDTSEHTLRRMCTVMAGDTNGFDAFDPLAEWDVYDQNTFEGLGGHCGF